jgi:hypothetical protein
VVRDAAVVVVAPKVVTVGAAFWAWHGFSSPQALVSFQRPAAERSRVDAGLVNTAGAAETRRSL